MHGTIKKDLRRRTIVENVIGHFRSDGPLPGAQLSTGNTRRQTECIAQPSGPQLLLVVEMIQKAFLDAEFIDAYLLNATK